MSTSASRMVRLRRHAKTEGRPVAEILQYYAMERFLYRLGQSEHASSFVLKGAVMLRVWDAKSARSTRDIDFLAFGDNELDQVTQRLREVCDLLVPEDGISFAADSFKAERIKEGDDYQGARIRFVALLENARIQMQIDLGFGDVVHPEILWADFPTLLGDPMPRIRHYSRETVIAEKVQAMAKLKELNSRMKDFHDLRHLSRLYPFRLDVLSQAIAKTFAARKTMVTTELVIGQPEYIATHQAMWKAFLTKQGDNTAPEDFRIIAQELKVFLIPALDAAVGGLGSELVWNPIARIWE